VSLLDPDLMPHSVTIFGPPDISQDTSGGDNPTWPTIRTANVPCQIMAGAGGERDEFEQSQRPVSTHTIVFGYGGDGGVRPGDKLVDDNTGKTYRFTGDRPQQGIGGIGDFNVITVRQVD